MREDKMTTIEQWTRLHAADVNFIPKARLLIDSVAEHSPDKLENFVRQMTGILCLDGKEHLAISLATYPHGLDLSGEEPSEIGKRLLTQLQLSGSYAPALPGKEVNRKIDKGLIVLFFESDCPNCHFLIDELSAAQDSLTKAGIQIMSISSDTDPNIYNTYAEQLPWTNKYCDYNSFSGDYFKLWGVASTPTMFFVDNRNIVKGRYYSLEDIKHRIK